MSRPIEVPSVQDLPDELHRRSGVYVIRSRETDRVLYVGESHTGRLKSTIMRHFYPWKKDWMHKTPRATYSRHRCSVLVYVTPPSEAIERQNALICELEPRDNMITTGCNPF